MRVSRLAPVVAFLLLATRIDLPSICLGDPPKRPFTGGWDDDAVPQDGFKDLKAAKTQLHTMKTPPWLACVKWNEAVKLDKAVTDWLAARSMANGADEMEAFGDGAASVRAAKRALLAGPGGGQRRGNFNNGLQAFEFDTNAFHYLAALGLEDAIKDLAQSSPSMGVFDQDRFGMTSLDYAALYGRTAVVHLLRPEKKLTTVERHYRPLNLAAVMGHAETVQEILHDDFSPLEIDEQGKCALQYAAEGGDDATVKALLAKALEEPEFRRKPVPLRGEFLRAAAAAVRSKHVGALRPFLKSIDLRVELEWEDPDPVEAELQWMPNAEPRPNSELARLPAGISLLHYAAQHGDKAIVEFLVNEAHLHAASFDKEGRPPLFYASSAEIAEFLIQKDAGLLEHTDAEDRSAAHCLAAWGSGDALQRVIKARPKLLMEKAKDGRTPLEFATAENSPGTLKALLDAGADPKIIVNNSDRPASVPDALIKGAVGKVKEGRIIRTNSTLLHIAAREGGQQVGQILVNAGIDVNAVDDCGRTPLMVAILHDHFDFAKWLLSISTKSAAKVDVNITTRTGSQAIHFAACKKDIELIGELVKAGADINAKVAGGPGMLNMLEGCTKGFDSGATPFDLARANRNWQVANRIKQLGGKPEKSKE